MNKCSTIFLFVLCTSLINGQNWDIYLTSGQKLLNTQFEKLENDTLYIRHIGITKPIIVSDIEKLKHIPIIITYPGGVSVGGYLGCVVGANLSIMLFDTYETFLSPTGLLFGAITGPIIANKLFTKEYIFSNMSLDEREDIIRMIMNK